MLNITGSYKHKQSIQQLGLVRSLEIRVKTRKLSPAPQACIELQMRATDTDAVTWRDLSLCVLGTRMSAAKAAEPIEMSSGRRQTRK